MNQTVIQLLSAFVGSLGFALLFGIRLRCLFASAAGGLLTWAVYLLVYAQGQDIFAANLLAAAFSVAYSEIMARLLHTPAPLFLTPAILPLVPGYSLYYTMLYAVQGDIAQFRSSGTDTLKATLAIAAGISISFAVRELHTLRKGDLS